MITAQYLSEHIKPVPGIDLFSLQILDLKEKADYFELSNLAYLHPVLGLVKDFKKGVLADGFCFEDDSDIWIGKTKYGVYRVGADDIKLFIKEEYL